MIGFLNTTSPDTYAIDAQAFRRGSPKKKPRRSGVFQFYLTDWPVVLGMGFAAVVFGAGVAATGAVTLAALACVAMQLFAKSRRFRT